MADTACRERGVDAVVEIIANSCNRVLGVREKPGVNRVMFPAVRVVARRKVKKIRS
jgi:hypothetical protein